MNRNNIQTAIGRTEGSISLALPSRSFWRKLHFVCGARRTTRNLLPICEICLQEHSRTCSSNLEGARKQRHR